MVKDNTGKPVRGARITAASGNKSVSRFSDNMGRYKITDLQPGAYEVAAAGWGWERKANKQELSGDAAMNFTLAPRWDTRQLSSADWLSALPENEETLTLRATCIRCHNLSYAFRRKGMTASQWTNLVLNMGEFGDILQGKSIGTDVKSGMFDTTPEKAAKIGAIIGAILGKYCGPNSPLPTREQVRRPQLRDAVLRATFREYRPPTRLYIHSVIPDLEGKYVWFSYFGDVPGIKEKIRTVRNRDGRVSRYPIASRDIHSAGEQGRQESLGSRGRQVV